jgi:hypothetical protein
MTTENPPFVHWDILNRLKMRQLASPGIRKG